MKNHLSHTLPVKPSSPLLTAIRRHLKTPVMAMLLACLALWSVQTGRAATFTWDITPGTVGPGDSAITGGLGTWNLTNGNWTTNAGVNNVVWGNSTVDEAIFGGTSGTITINTGAGITANKLTFNADGYTVNGNVAADVITLAGTTPTIAVTTLGHTATIGAILAGAAGLTKTGEGTLTLNGVNTYTGITTISAGTVKLGNDSALGSVVTPDTDHTIVAAGATLDLNGRTIAEQFGRATTTVTDGFGGVAAILTNSNAAAASITGEIGFNGAGAFTVNGANDISLTRVRRVTGSNNVIITKADGGTLTLAGTLDNSFLGVIVNGGVVQLNKGGTGVRALGAVSSIGASGTLRLTTGQANGDQIFSAVDLANDGTFDLQGQDESFDGMTGTGLVTNGATSNASLLTLGEANGTFTWGGVIQDGAGTSTLALTKIGTGTMTITGTNTYTGATQINGVGGGITLDFATAVGTTNLISSASALTMNNTAPSRTQTLTLTGKASTVNSQTFINTSITGNGTRHQVVVTSGATGGTMNLSLGALTLTNSPFVDFVLPATGSIATTNANTIFGPRVTVNNGGNYAQILSNAIVAYNGSLIYATGINIGSLVGYDVADDLLVDSTSSGNVIQAAGTTQLNTLQFTDAAARTLTLGAGNTLQLGATGGILRGSTAGSVVIGAPGNAGTLTTGTSAGADLIFTNGNATGDLTVNSVIANNGGGAVDVLINGIAGGTTILAGANTTTGAITVQNGILRATNNTSLGTVAGGVTLFDGAALELSGGITIGDEALSIFGTGVGGNGALRNLSGTNTYGGLVTMAAASEIQADTGSMLIFDRPGTATAVTSASSVTFDTPGLGIITFNDTLVTTGNANPTITKTGTGVLNLTVANTFAGTGGFDISAGTVRISNGGALGATTNNTTVSASAALELIGGITTSEAITLDDSTGISSGGAIRNISGSNIISGTVVVDNGDGRINSDADLLTLNATTALRGDPSSSAAARTVTIGGAGNTTISGIVANGAGGTPSVLNLAKDGLGTLTLSSGSNSYTGTTAVSGGLLRVTGATNAASSVAVSGGALGGTGTIGGAVTVSSTGGINLADGAVGNLTLSSTLNITGAAGANSLRFDLGNATNTTDKIIVGGATTVTNAGAAVINLNQLGGVAGRNAAGTYTLIQGTTSMAAVGQFALPTTSAFGQTFALSVVGNDLRLTTTQVTATGTTAFWSGAVSGSWLTTSATAAFSNWNTDVDGNVGFGAAGPAYTADVTFGTTTPVMTNLSTTLDADQDINSLTLSPLTGGITIASGATPRMLTLESSGTGITSSNTSLTNTISANIGLANSQTWSVASGGTLLVSGVISDFAAGRLLTKAGAGTLTLSAANTYSGGTTINDNSGTLNATINIAGTSNALGTGPVSVGAGSTLVLDITKTTNVTDAIANTFTGAGLLKMQFAANNSNNRSTSMPNVTGFTGTIQLSRLGATRDKWTATDVGTVVGSLIVDTGTTIYVATGTGVSFTGGITLNGTGNGENRGAIRLDNATLGGNISLASSSTINMGNAAALLTGNITSGAVGTQTLTLGANGSTGGTLSGIIGGGTGTIALATAVGGTYTLSGANTYAGITTISAGTLALTGSLINASLGNVVVNAGGTLNVSGTLTGSNTTTSLTYGTGAGLSTVNVSSGANISLFAITGSQTTSAVSIWNQIGGTVTANNGAADSIVAGAGYGYMNLSGGSYTAGRFSVANNGTAPSGVARIGGGAGTATLSSSEFLFIARGLDAIGELTVLPNGIVDHNGASAQVVLGANAATPTSFLNIVGGVFKSDTQPLQIGNGASATTTVSMINVGSGSLEIGRNIAFNTGGTGNKAYVNFAGGTVKVTGSSVTTMLLPASNATFNSLANTIFGQVNNSTANLGGGAPSAVSSVLVNGTAIGTTQDFVGGVTIDTNNNNATINGPLVAPTGGGLDQEKVSTMITNPGSGYSGPPTVVFSSPAASGATPAAGYAVLGSGATAGQVVGIVLTSPGSYASGDTVSVTLSGGGATTPATVATISGATLTANTSGGLTKIGAGTLTLSGANTYTGNTVVSDGTLQLGSGAGTGSMSTSSAISVNTGATFAVNQSDTVTQGTDFATAAITGLGGFAQTGSGTTILTAANSYDGTTAVTAGTLIVNGNQSAANGAVSVAGGSTLGGDGTIGGSTTIAGSLRVGTTTAAAVTGTLDFIDDANANKAVSFGATSTWFIDIVEGSNTSDSISVGVLSIASGAQLSFATTGTFNQTEKFTLASYTNTWNGADIFSGYANNSFHTIGSGQYQINYADNGNFITLTAVPEPGTFGLLGLALAGLAFLRFRKRRADAGAAVD